MGFRSDKDEQGAYIDIIDDQQPTTKVAGLV